MKNYYLVLAFIGYAVTGALMLLETIENHNILLWTKPSETVAGLFGNRISTIFAIDLLLAILVFFLWTMSEAKRLGMKNVWKYWVLTLLFGLAGTFPLFLWAREKQLSRVNN